MAERSPARRPPTPLRPCRRSCTAERATTANHCAAAADSSTANAHHRHHCAAAQALRRRRLPGSAAARSCATASRSMRICGHQWKGSAEKRHVAMSATLRMKLSCIPALPSLQSAERRTFHALTGLSSRRTSELRCCPPTEQSRLFSRPDHVRQVLDNGGRECHQRPRPGPDS